MGKRDREKKRKQQQSRPEESSGGGTMMSLRGGFKGLASGKSGPRTPLQKAWDVIFWALIIAALGFVLVKRFGS